MKPGHYALFLSVVLILSLSSSVDAQKIYWADSGPDKIQKSDLDGTNIEDLVTGVSVPYGLALDLQNGKMYWANILIAQIQRSNLDGSDVETVVSTTSSWFLAIDISAGKLYWTDRGADKIQRSNLDGSEIEDLITEGLDSPRGIALDIGAGKIYWTDDGTQKIQRSNLDGSEIEDLVTLGLDGPESIALDPSNSKMYWTEREGKRIKRANLDGSDLQTLITGLGSPIGIAIDFNTDKLYWSDDDRHKIQRSNLDGSDIEDVVTGDDTFDPAGIVLVNDTDSPPIAKLDKATTAVNQSIDIAVAVNDFDIDGNIDETTVSIVSSPVHGVLSVNSATGIVTYTPAISYLGTDTFEYTIKDNEGNVSNPATVSLQVNPAVQGRLYWTDGLTGKIKHSNLDGSVPSADLVSGLNQPWDIELDVVNGKMYWTEIKFDAAKIRRSNLNGSGIEELIDDMSRPQGLALDVAGGKMYWTDFGAKKIRRSNLDGTSVEDLVTVDLDLLEDIELDIVNGKIYWVDDGNGKIKRANLDGSDVEALVDDNMPRSLRALALDVPDGKMYWAGNGRGKMARSNLDGSDIEDLFSGDSFTVLSIELDLIGRKMYWSEFDLSTGDNKILRSNLDGSEIEILMEGANNSQRHIALLTQDIQTAVIDDNDPTMLMSLDGTVTEVQFTSGNVAGHQISLESIGFSPPPVAQTIPIAGAPLLFVELNTTIPDSVDFNAKVTINYTDAQLTAGRITNEEGIQAAWFNEADSTWNFVTTTIDVVTNMLMFETSRFSLWALVTQQPTSIEIDQASEPPISFRLTQNRPNPFNPGTQIIYEVPRPTHISLMIYNILGQEISRLVDTVQASGRYVATWDGTNYNGIPVASGVYIYRLTAGNGFSQTKRMTLLR